jgi:hypothetical protein
LLAVYPSRFLANNPGLNCPPPHRRAVYRTQLLGAAMLRRTPCPRQRALGPGAVTVTRHKLTWHARRSAASQPRIKLLPRNCHMSGLSTVTQGTPPHHHHPAATVAAGVTQQRDGSQKVFWNPVPWFGSCSHGRTITRLPDSTPVLPVGNRRDLGFSLDLLTPCVTRRPIFVLPSLCRTQRWVDAG